MAQFNNFNGGLDLQTAPHLLQANEAQINCNTELGSVSLRPLSSDTNEGVKVDKSIINFNGTWLRSNTLVDYTVYKERLYKSDGIGKPLKSFDGATWHNLGIVGPTIKPTTGIARDGANTRLGPLQGTSQWCYTYYNVTDGAESAPSPYSDEVVCSDSVVDVTVTTSTDPQVTHIRVYRIGDHITRMTLVDSILNSTRVFVDNVTGLDVDGKILTSHTALPAKEGLTNLLEHNSMLFGTLGDKLWYSEIADVDSWSAYNFIDFDAPITGIGSLSGGLLVFTRYKTFIVTGTSPNTLSKYLLNGNQGCISHRSIRFADNALIWLSTDGICVSSGGEIKLVSRNKLNKKYLASLGDIQDSIVYDDKYLVGYKNLVLIVDFRFGTTFRHMDTKIERFSIHDDQLYYSYNRKLYSVGTNDEPKTLLYKTGKISEGQVSNLKNYKSIYTSTLGEMNIVVYVDGKQVLSNKLDSGFTETLIPQLKRRGYYLEFEFEGTGEVLELQYVAEGRQNGK